jgi:integrating conjugative element relaxase (TIGR03760 family)
VSGWIAAIAIATVICAAAALDLIEIRWSSSHRLRTRLAQRLHAILLRLETATPEDIAAGADASLAPSPQEVTSVVPPADHQQIVYRGAEAGWYKVLSAADLIACIEGEEVVRKIVRATRVAPDMFERDLQPALRHFAEFVQLLPASESHHHANPGGLLAHTLETVLHALTIRTGYLLPLGAGAEVIAAERDFWTYAVFLSALLHDVGKPVADLKIQWKRGKTGAPVNWFAAAGSLNDCGASEYFVGFKNSNERNYEAHARLGAILLQRLVPGTTLAAMAQVPDGLQELNRYLAGERAGALHEIVQKADQESTRRNLASGPRARFSTAKTVPLIERLMGAMVAMFREGGHLPLNRDGAAGWVHGDYVWLVAKRLADSVREFILRQEEGAESGFPGESKNDRLFDAWQEYGCVRTNPATGQAIWRVVVTGTSASGEVAYRHELSVLCFPVAKIWNDLSQYPAAMSGTVEAIATPVPVQHEPDAAAAPATVDGLPADSGASKKIPAPKFVAQDSAAINGPAAQEADDFLDERDTAAAEARSARQEKAANKRSGTSAVSSAADSQAAAAIDGVAQPMPEANAQPADACLHFPVALPVEKLPMPGNKPAREPTELAVAFMKWVQRHLADGSMKHNEAGAPVHFIEYGMVLVSPLIFRLYAAANDAPAGLTEEDGDFAMRVQRELLRAQWHATAPGGKNVWTLYVSKKGGQGASRLAAVVLKEPRRWVVPVPPSNPFIRTSE